MASDIINVQPTIMVVPQPEVPTANFTHIFGPRQPCNDIDVFLEPLLEDMKMLFEEGVHMWDEYQQEYFTLHAIIFVTINDYTTLRMLFGQVKWKTSYVVCVDEISHLYLPYFQKTVYR